MKNSRKITEKEAIELFNEGSEIWVSSGQFDDDSNELYYPIGSDYGDTVEFLTDRVDYYLPID